MSGYDQSDYIRTKHDLAEATSEILRHHELIEKMRAGIVLLYDAAAAGRTDLDPRWEEIEEFMSWVRKEVG